MENYEIKDRFIAGNVVQKAEDVKAWIDREEERIKNFPGYDGIEPYIAMAQDSLKALEEATREKSLSPSWTSISARGGYPPAYTPPI